MTITDHTFTNQESEYARVKALLLDIETRPEIDNNWEPGRMDYWRYNLHAEKGVEFFRANAHYWQTDTGQVVALFISEYGRNDFFIVLHPDFQHLFTRALHWGMAHWANGKEKISTDVYTFGRQKIRQLQAAGFYEDGHIENVWTYQMAGYDFSYQLKLGFTLQTLTDFGNLESRVKLVQNAFDNPGFNERRLRSLLGSPGYRPDLDLVIVNATGESVAYCMGWVEETSPKVGYIEPMGVHSNYRRHGFASILAKETFKRLHSLGVERVWIASNAEPHIANYLYGALNPDSVKRSFRYTLNLHR